VDALEARKNVRLSIDLKPALDDLKLDHRLQRDLDAEGKKSLKNIFKLWLPSALIPFFLEKLQIDASKNGHQVTGAERKQIRLMMKNMVFDITGYRPFKEAIITAGGVDTREINASTMESKLIKGLYFAGEVLNLDGDTGGYNLQIAWSTGWVAGYNAARSL
jgi:predicted Rossmann fold flavoprotein